MRRKKLHWKEIPEDRLSKEGVKGTVWEGAAELKVGRKGGREGGTFIFMCTFMFELFKCRYILYKYVQYIHIKPPTCTPS